MAELLIENISKSFFQGETAVKAVDGVTLKAEGGEVLLLMGPSGSGKTTLLAIGGCLLRPDSGKVYIGGQDVTALPQRSLPALRLQRIGFIFQSFNLISTLTAAENVELVLRMAGRSQPAVRALELLAELGLEKRASFLPAQLSGGERQRVAVARALATDPAVILADEPTANLDSRSGQQVVHLLAEAARRRGKAVVIVSHDTRLRDVADRVVLMEDGRLRVGA